jgi:hypothetical protein
LGGRRRTIDKLKSGGNFPPDFFAIMTGLKINHLNNTFANYEVADG